MPGIWHITEPFAQRFDATHRERLETLRSSGERGAWAAVRAALLIGQILDMTKTLYVKVLI
jgi:hypothetical protein